MLSQSICTNQLNRRFGRVWHVLYYLQKTRPAGWWSTALFNVMLSDKSKVQWWWGCWLWKQWFLKHVSGPGHVLLLGCFIVCEKNQAHQRNAWGKKKKHIPKKHRHISIRVDIQKCILHLISITVRYCKNNYSSLLKLFRVKNILKNVMLQDFRTNRLMHVKQFTEAFQWESSTYRALSRIGRGECAQKPISFIKPKLCVQSTNQQ